MKCRIYWDFIHGHWSCKKSGLYLENDQSSGQVASDLTLFHLQSFLFLPTNQVTVYQLTCYSSKYLFKILQHQRLQNKLQLVLTNSNYQRLITAKNPTAQKVSVFGVIPVWVFLHLNWMQRDTKYPPIQSKWRKMRTRITQNTRFFHTVPQSTSLAFDFFILRQIWDGKLPNRKFEFISIVQALSDLSSLATKNELFGQLFLDHNKNMEKQPTRRRFNVNLSSAIFVSKI